MTRPKQLILCFFLWHLMFSSLPSSHRLNILASAAGGKWEIQLSSVGIAAMHMQLLKNDRVVMYDRTDFGQSNISLSNGQCRNDNNDTALKVDCTAHSVEYDVSKNIVRPLKVLTDVWCSSGSVMPDGELIQTGGFNDGDRVIRSFKPCEGCDWNETQNGLIARRWYATNLLLPEGRQIVIGGRREFNYEFYPKDPLFDSNYSLPFLVQTNDVKIENNLYPFVFLNSDGNLFIFANNRAILFDYKTRLVVKNYPQIPGGDPRNYPSTGSAVMLPLKNLQDKVVATEVLVCGGAPKGSYVNVVTRKTFVKALNTCARISVNDPNPQWTMETMPMARVMGDMLLLPNGHVLIINGAGTGTAGWEFARDPVLNPVVYKPDNPLGSRFEVQNPTTIPRMYHSTALLLRDGRVLVGGSNPHSLYVFGNVSFPTELRLEAFSPSYLEPGFANLRPKIVTPVSPINIGYGTRIKFRFVVTGKLNANLVKVTMASPPFNTHSYSMNQRLLFLKNDIVTSAGKSTYEVKVTLPGSGNLAPAGNYILYVVHQDIPSEGIWAKLQ